MLKEIDAGEKRQLIVLNKIDLVEDEQIFSRLKKYFNKAILVSALNKLRLDELLKGIQNIMDEGFQTVELNIPYTEGKIISEIQVDLEVLEKDYTDEGVRMTVKGPKSKIRKILGQLS